LKNGDQVEILTSPQAHPSKDWLTFVKTSRAQQKIRAFIRQQQREKSLQLGRELADREFRRFSLNFSKMLKNGGIKELGKELGYRTEDDMMVALGYGKLAPHQLIQRLVTPEKLAETEERAAKDGASGATPPAGVAKPSGLNRVAEMAKKLVGRPSHSGVQIGGGGGGPGRVGRRLHPGARGPTRRVLTPARGAGDRHAGGGE